MLKWRSPLKHKPSFTTCITCLYTFLCHFYEPYINLIASDIVRFSNEEDEQILGLQSYCEK